MLVKVPGDGDGDGGGGLGGGGEGDGGGGEGGGASWLMVTSVFVHAEPQLPPAARHVARPCGGEDESSEMWCAQRLQVPPPSRLLAAVVLGASLSKIQRAVPPLPPPQSGSQ